MSNNQKKIAAGNAAAPVRKFNVKQLTGLGLLTALVIVLQFIGLALRPTGFFNITLCLVPIVVGAALYGVKAGAWLGFVFGVMVTITDSAAFMIVNAPATIAVCILKGTLAGLAAGAVYRMLENRAAFKRMKEAETGDSKKSKGMYVATLAAAIVCPIVNTGVFVLGCFAFFMPTIAEWGLEANVDNAVYYLFAVIIGVNFLIEFGVNLVLGSAIVTIIKQAKKSY